VYVRALQQAGHEVRHAISAQVAVQLSDELMPDAVVLELQMPRHNGVEFLYEFRSYGEWLHIPVLVHSFVPLSQLAEMTSIQKELGVQRVLYKPTTSLRQLCAALRQIAPVAL
jgi:CheY-like chemotaxis protein